MKGTKLEKKLKHLELVQAVVNRLSQNSFLLKGWSVVLLAALLTLAANNESARYTLIAFVPLLVFWCLDGYFLHHERLFRKLYDHVRELEEDNVDFEMNHVGFAQEARSYADALLSKTLLFFHGTLLVVLVCVTIVLLR